MKHLARVVPFAVAILCMACGKSDERVTADLRAQLSAAKVDTSQVSVETRGPLVTLSGTVASTPERDEITRIVRLSAGGKDVLDKMTVREAPAAAIAPSISQPTGGASIETAVATAPAQDSGSTLSHAASATGSAVTTGAKASGDAVTSAAKVTGDAVVDASKATANATVKGAEVAGEATADAAKATGNATVKGAEATASGAKKLGSGVAGAFGGGEKSDKK